VYPKAGVFASSLACGVLPVDARGGAGKGCEAMGKFRRLTGAALVTGASGGIGLELARALAAREMSVILVARSAENLRILASELATAHKIRAVAIPADLSTPEGPSELVRRLADVDLDIDVLVNNAGFGIYGSFGNAGPEREAQMIRLNVVTPTELAARLLPGMLRRRRGLILNVASTAGFAPTPWIGTYAATKAYLVSWTISLDTELEGTGVRAAVLCPGTTETGFQKVSGAAEHRRRRMPQQSASEVAKECMRGLDRGKCVIVTGGLNKLHVLAAKIVPARLAARIARHVMVPKKVER
jgi:hypothetical protein